MASSKVKPNDKKFSMLSREEVIKMAGENTKRGQKARKEAAKRGLSLETNEAAES